MKYIEFMSRKLITSPSINYAVTKSNFMDCFTVILVIFRFIPKVLVLFFVSVGRCPFKLRISNTHVARDIATSGMVNILIHHRLPVTHV